MINKVFDFLKKSGTFYVATVDGEKPRVRPFGFTMIYNGKLYFCTNNQKPVFKQLGKNSHIEICACIGVDWLRISGKAVFDESMEAKKAVLEVDPGMSALYKAEDEIFEVFYIEEGYANFSSLSGGTIESGKF